MYDHYAALVGDVPDAVWTTLFRDALFIPHSAPYRAVNRLLQDPGADVRRVAEELGVEEGLLRPAVSSAA